ncbi:MAG TPA: cytochrome c oxidase subunit 3 family protein [Terriglobales bacterium]|nr:cytochrome c oxidase subunit 3 family protein [Terriglobales bacterium]
MPSSEAAVANQTHDNPALLHHFASAEQQKNAASFGMWLFLATEIMFFGGMFCAYLIYRYWYFGDFGAASKTLDIRLGTINTAVLICSSFTVAMAVRSAQTGKRKAIAVFLLLTIVLGLVFLGIKGVEYKAKFEEHHVPGQADFHLAGSVPLHPDLPVNQAHAQMYFSLYFAMTGMHALHMVIGVGLFSFLTYEAWNGRYSPSYYTPIENGGLYWHFVDIIWIYLFPLFYLIERHR